MTVTAPAATRAMVASQEQRGGLALDIERVLIAGDLGKLNAEQRLEYYSRLCQSLGLNPLTRPFEYLVLKGKTVLYARKDATEQLRKLHGISIERPEVIYSDDLVIVSVTARDATGRTDSDLGVVPIAGLKGEDRANAVMKALTKGKRRATLSICGLGVLDESEIEGAQAGEMTAVHTQTAPPRRVETPRSAVLEAAAPSVSPEELRAQVQRLEAADPEGAAKLPKTAAEMNEAELSKTYAWYTRRARFSEMPAAPPPAQQLPVDMTKEERLEGALGIARETTKRLRAEGGTPNAGAVDGLRILLREIQACEPLPDDVDPRSISSRDMLAAVEERLAVADQPTPTPSPDNLADTPDPENVPF